MPFMKRKTAITQAVKIGAGIAAAAMTKRRAGKTATTTKRRKPKRPDPQGNEYRKFTYKNGRNPKLTLRNLAKEVHANRSKLTLAHRDYTTWGSSQGAWVLACAQSALGATLTCQNVLLFDLTAVTNADSAGVVQTPVAYSYPVFSNETDTANLTWVNGPQWTIERNESITGTISAHPGARAEHQWTSIKALLYSAGIIATKVEFTIMKFRDEDLVPGATVTTKTTAFWQSILHPAVKNPICTNTPMWTRKAVKQISRKTFILDPKETTENVQANLTEVNMFIKQGGRVLHYDADTSVDRINLIQDDDTFVNLGRNGTTTDVKSRTYLMIRAYTRRNTIADIVYHPSMDIIIRNCFTYGT